LNASGSIDVCPRKTRLRKVWLVNLRTTGESSEDKLVEALTKPTRVAKPRSARLPQGSSAALYRQQPGRFLRPMIAQCLSNKRWPIYPDQSNQFAGPRFPDPGLGDKARNSSLPCRGTVFFNGRSCVFHRIQLARQIQVPVAHLPYAELARNEAYLPSVEINVNNCLSRRGVAPRCQSVGAVTARNSWRVAARW